MNEYEEDNSLFTRAFPWLFPGGYGDFGQFRDKKINVGDWTKKSYNTKMGGLQTIGYGAFLPLILLLGRKINLVEDSL